MGIKDKINNLRDTRKKKKIDEEAISLIMEGKGAEAIERLGKSYKSEDISSIYDELEKTAIERSEGHYQEFKYNNERKSVPTSGVRNAKAWYPEGFLTPHKAGPFKISIGKFFFVMFVIAASLVLPYIFKESGSAWFLSFAATTWAVATLFPSHLNEEEEEKSTALLMLKASLNGVATIFLSLGLIAISPTTPFMRLLTLIVFTLAYLSFPTSGGSETYKAYLATWRMILGFYFVFFFIFAFMNVLSVSAWIFGSLALLAFAFYFNFPEVEGLQDKVAGAAKALKIKVDVTGESGSGMMVWGIMMMLFGASMALFLGNMKFFIFGTYTWATLFYFGGIIILLISSASAASGEAVLFSAIASLGLGMGAFELWRGGHYFAAMGYNMLVGLSVSTGAASVQSRPIIGVTALSFAVIILSSAFPAVLGEAVFGQWWPQVEGGVTTLVGPMTDTVGQMQEGFQNAFLMFSCPSCYYEKQLEQQQASSNLKSGGTTKGIEVSDFTFQVVNIPEQPLLATATLENKGEFTANNIQTTLKVLQTKNKKGEYAPWENIYRKFVTCSGGTKSTKTQTDDTCTWSDPSYKGDMKMMTFTYGYETASSKKPWDLLGNCVCYESDGDKKGYCKSTADDPTGCRKCTQVEGFLKRETGTGTEESCFIGIDKIGYEYAGSYIVVGFDYYFDYIVNVSLDTQLMQSDTLNDLLLKKQITLREVRADYSGGPVKASIWTQKQPVRANEETLAVISVENSGTGSVKSAPSSTCAGVGGICRYEGLTEKQDPIIGDCSWWEKKIQKEGCGKTTVVTPLGSLSRDTYCCVPETYTETATQTAEYVLTVPFISGIAPKIKEVSKGGLNCGKMDDIDIIKADYKGGLGRVLKDDSYDIHCVLEKDLTKGTFARYAFLFNYTIPKEIDRKSVIFVGNVKYQYQGNYTKEAQISWVPPQ